MRSHVFTDRELGRHAGRFVWLSIDTEKEANVGFLEQFPIDAYPALLVVDPSTGQVAFKWLGSATVGQLSRLLEDGERAVKGGGESPAHLALTRADRLYADHRAEEAAAAFREALAAAPPQWPARPRAVESLIVALSGAGQPEACARAAAEFAPSLPRGPSFANAVALGLSCVLGEDEKAPWRSSLLERLEPLAREAVELPGLLADDRSGLFDELADCAAARGDGVAEKKAVLDWLAFLEAQAAQASSPEARAAFDPHRVAAALRAGDPERAVPPLLQSEQDLPGDYNAPARLALLYQELGRYDEALAATDRALARVYGPRKLRLLETRAGISLKKGDPEAARRSYQEAIAAARSLPPAQRSERAIKRLEAALAKVPGR